MTSPSRIYRDLILELAETGASSRAIAEQIGGGLTRNMVIGVCGRAGSGVGNRKQSAGSKRGWAKRKGKTMVARTPAPIADLAPVAPHDPDDIWPAKGGCFWPIGDPHEADFRFCCAKRGGDHRYCDEHHRIAFRTRDQEGGL